MRTLKPALAAIVLGAIAFLASKSLAQDATNALPLRRKSKTAAMML